MRYSGLNPMPGAARPLSLRLGADGLRALDEIARRRGITRAEAARRAITETAERERRRAGVASNSQLLSSEASTMLAGNPLDEPVFQVSVISVDIPELEAQTDLEIRLRGADGDIVPAAGIDQTGYLFLNRYVFERSN
jgi:hypothetical protein